MGFKVGLAKRIKGWIILGITGILYGNSLCIGMELQSEEKKRNSFHLNLKNLTSSYPIDSDSRSPNGYSPANRKIIISSDDYDKTEIYPSFTEEVIDIRVKGSIRNQINIHVNNHTHLISENGFYVASKFLTDLECFVKSELLLRIDDGASNKNKDYYCSIKNICTYYMILFRVVNSKNNGNTEIENTDIVSDNMYLEEFYNANAFKVYEQQRRQCTKQRNACITILNEMNMFFTKANTQLENKGFSLIATEWCNKRLERFGEFISDHGKFITECLKERTQFLDVLSVIFNRRQLKGKTPDEFLFNTSELLFGTIKIYENKINQEKNARTAPLEMANSSDSAPNFADKKSKSPRNIQNKILERKKSRKNIFYK